MSIYATPAIKIDIVPNGITRGKKKRDVDSARVKEMNGIQRSSRTVLFCGKMAY